MVRVFDLFFSVVGGVLGFPIFVVLFLYGIFENGKPIFFQERIGLGQKKFLLIKFRTMKVGTLSVGTHLVDPAAVTKFGAFLRRTKLDELPQLWNVLKGEMSLVGPRPCLPNQTELIEEREKRGVFFVRPGITGLAQIQGIDMSQPERLAQVDAEMVNKGISLPFYFRCIVSTVRGQGQGDRVIGS